MHNDRLKLPVPPLTAAPGVGKFCWTEIPQSELGAWAVRLCEQENPSIRQSPVYNEQFRRFLTRPIYLKGVAGDGAVAGIVCVLELGICGIKIGVVVNGPVELGKRGQLAEGLPALVAWLRSRGFWFVRFSRNHESAAKELKQYPEAVSENPLPFMPCYGGELAVYLDDDDNRLQHGFQAEARREIRRAEEEGLVIKQSSDLEEFRKVWDIFPNRARVKGIRVAKFDNYAAMFRLSLREDLIRMYTAYYDGQLVYAAVFLRECRMVHYFLGALDETTLGERPSPSCLVHWKAMRDYRKLGCRWYNLGGRSGPVYTFKSKFRPGEVPMPEVFTLVFQPRGYAVWTKVLLKAYKMMQGGEQAHVAAI